MWKPKAELIAKKLKKNQLSNYSYVDIGGGYGFFAEEISKYTKNTTTVIEPSPFMAEACKKKKIECNPKIFRNCKKE